MQQKIIVAVLLTTAVSLNAMEKESLAPTKYTSVFSFTPVTAEEQAALEQQVAVRYQGINNIDPRTQTSPNAILERYIDSISRSSLNETIPGQLVGPLHIAARSDFDNDTLTKCLRIMNNCRIPTNGCDTLGNTPLMVACDYRAVKNTETLVACYTKTKNLDNADKELRTALHHICSPTLDSFNAEEISRRFNCAEILLRNGATADVLDERDKTPLCYLATSFFGSFTNTPATTPLNTEKYERFMCQRKALISLLIRHKANTEYALKRIQKSKENNSSDYLSEFEDHLNAPIQNHDCNLN